MRGFPLAANHRAAIERGVARSKNVNQNNKAASLLHTSSLQGLLGPLYSISPPSQD